VVVLAAGEGSRLGLSGPKALALVAGRSLLAHTLAALAAAGLPPAVVVYPPGHRDDAARSVAGLPVAGFVTGGGTRTQSVRAGLAAIPRSASLVVIHEAARPLMPPEVIRRTVDAVRTEHDTVAAAPSLPVSDILKRVDGNDTVLGTVGRGELVGIQTPQVVPRVPFERALAADDGTTDDLGLIEALVDAGELHGRVRVVLGSVFGRKVTYPDDLVMVEALAAGYAPVPATGSLAAYGASTVRDDS
jgi:2-C-methyl-D-erythritol 4-phosphate cytidylyltransferase